MHKNKCILVLAAAVLLIFTLSGCTVGSIEALYSLPQPSERYLQLQSIINREIADGSEYSAPISGSNRQSIQLYDIDGDGVDEAIAYLRGANHTLRICIYRNIDGEYVHATTIEGEGASIGSVEFADLNGNGESELLATWQVSSGLRILNVYSLRDFEVTALATCSCTDFMIYDITGDGVSDLLVLDSGTSEAGNAGQVELYSFFPDSEPLVSSVRLSEGLEPVERMRSGYLSDMSPAVFLEGGFEDEDGSPMLITDILAFSGGKLVNISMDSDTGISGAVRYNHRGLPYSRDINGDRIMDVPESVPLYNQADADTTAYWVFDWYSYDIEGNRTLSVSTYHASDGWYITLPTAWRDTLTVRREDVVSGERVIVLSSRDPETGHILDFLTVYTLTGDNRSERAQFPGRFILYGNSPTTIYAARRLVDEGEWPHALSEEEIIKRFKLIYSEWTAGVLSN